MENSNSVKFDLISINKKNNHEKQVKCTGGCMTRYDIYIRINLCIVILQIQYSQIAQ